MSGEFRRCLIKFAVRRLFLLCIRQTDVWCWLEEEDPGARTVPAFWNLTRGGERGSHPWSGQARCQSTGTWHVIARAPETGIGWRRRPTVHHKISTPVHSECGGVHVVDSEGCSGNQQSITERPIQWRCNTLSEPCSHFLNRATKTHAKRARRVRSDTKTRTGRRGDCCAQSVCECGEPK